MSFSHKLIYNKTSFCNQWPYFITQKCHRNGQKHVKVKYYCNFDSLKAHPFQTILKCTTWAVIKAQITARMRQRNVWYRSQVTWSITDSWSCTCYRPRVQCREFTCLIFCRKTPEDFYRLIYAHKKNFYKYTENTLTTSAHSDKQTRTPTQSFYQSGC